MLSGDRNYYRRRIGEEAAAADAAACPEARQAHLTLAELYSARLNLVEAISTGRAYSLASAGLSGGRAAAAPTARRSGSGKRAA